jgi:hypothetical protein
VGLLLQRFGLTLLGPSVFVFAVVLAAVYWVETKTLERGMARSSGPVP